MAFGVIIYFSGEKLNKQAGKKNVLCLHVNKNKKADKTAVYEWETSAGSERLQPACNTEYTKNLLIFSLIKFFLCSTSQTGRIARSNCQAKKWVVILELSRCLVFSNFVFSLSSRTTSMSVARHLRCGMQAPEKVVAKLLARMPIVISFRLLRWPR